MNISVPIPNWTGIVLGFALGSAVWFGFAAWAYRKDLKRKTNLMIEEVRKVGWANGGSGQ